MSNQPPYFTILNEENFQHHEGFKVQLSYYTLIWVKEGCLTLQIDTKEVELKNHLLILLPQHYLEIKKQDHLKAYLIQFDPSFYNMEWDTELFQNSLEWAKQGTFILNPTPEQQKELEGTFDEIYKEHQLPKSYQLQMLQVVLKRLIIKLLRYTEDVPQPPSNTTIRRFKQLVDLHFKQHRKVQSYAELMQISYTTLIHAFNEHKEKPHEVIQKRIFLEAQRLLHFTELPIKQIAYTLGFEDPSQFNKAFKSLHFLTPSQYRKKVKGRK
jgi:AraC-like DNA-binding protein